MAIADLASRLALVGVIAWLVVSHADIIWFAVAKLIPSLFALLIQGVAASRHISLRPVFSTRETRDLLRKSLAQMAICHHRRALLARRRRDPVAAEQPIGSRRLRAGPDLRVEHHGAVGVLPQLDAVDCRRPVRPRRRRVRRVHAPQRGDHVRHRHCRSR